MLATGLRVINVDMGEMEISTDSNDVLVSTGLGSCLVMCAYDPVKKVGGLARMLLPGSNKELDEKCPAKYIDIAVPLMIQRLQNRGVSKSNLIIKIVGGARCLTIPGEDNILCTGPQNVAEIKSALERENLAICAEDLGGKYGRSVEFFIDTGRIVLKTAKGNTKEL